MTDIVPFLWYTDKAVEAADFYISLIPNSHMGHVAALPSDSPSGPAGSVKVVDFMLAGRPFTAMSAGPLDPFNHAVSFVIECEDQAEVDKLWDGLSAGGKTEQCGWLQDRYGVYWQIVPKAFLAMIKDKDQTRSKRVAEAMMTMKKFDIATLQKAYDGG